MADFYIETSSGNVPVSVQGISHSAKGLSYYVGDRNKPLIRLIERCGDYMDSLTTQQLCLIVAALSDHLASESDGDATCLDYGIADSLESIDPDCLLGVPLSELTIEIVNESDADTLTNLIQAIAALMVDRARAGAWD